MTRMSWLDNTYERSLTEFNPVAMSHATFNNRKNTHTKNALKIVNVAFDVGSDSLHWAMLLGQDSFSGQCENNSTDVRKTLQQIATQARKQGDCEIRVICESTGVYHRRLLQIAESCDMRTNLVQGEAVAKFRAIQFGDHGKTDERDPKAALTVAQIGKLVKHRKFDERYAKLRELHRLVLRCEARIKVAKCELHADLRILFADLRLDKSVLYGPTGRALIEQFGGNPYAIIEIGEEGFCKQMKARSRRTKNATLKRIWEAAVSSVSGGEDRVDDELDKTLAEIRSAEVKRIYAEITVFLEQRDTIEKQMQAIYLQLQRSDARLPSPQKGVVTLRMLSRLVAEIGPPSDFRTLRQLMRYAGLNLCERQSGKWRGRTTISRRGRSELRYVLNLMSIPLVSRKSLYGEYYHRKKKTEKMPGQKALTCVMRKILKMFYGWYKSGGAFERDRVFTSLGQSKAA